MVAAYADNCCYNLRRRSLSPALRTSLAPPALTQSTGKSGSNAEIACDKFSSRKAEVFEPCLVAYAGKWSITRIGPQVTRGLPREKEVRADPDTSTF